MPLLSGCPVFGRGTLEVLRQWIAQGMLAGIFMMTGAMKLFQKKEVLADIIVFVDDFSLG
ncbi:MAG: hypothetical protein MUP11_09190 [Anaerolineales bacterium]|nr:hypothetical protein [Anaerolineales bacterium]